VTWVFLQPCLFLFGILSVISFWTSIPSAKRKKILVKGVVSVLWGLGLGIGYVLYLVGFVGYNAQTLVGSFDVIFFSIASHTVAYKDYLSKKLSSVGSLCVVPIAFFFISLGQSVCAGLIFLCMVCIVGSRAQSADIDNKDVLEFMRVLRRHKEHIQSNMTSLFSVTTKVHKNECHCVSQHATIMNLLVHQK
jgi:hypothetical protein